MDEYITRKDALAAITQADLQARTCFVAGDAKQKIRSIPAADVAPVMHGQWEIIEDDSVGETWIVCSVCGNDHLLALEQDLGCYDYCPRCGAKMDMEDSQNG